MFGRQSNAVERARLRAASSAAAGIILCGCALLIAVSVWPATRWMGAVADLTLFHQLIRPTVANAVFIVASYLAAASLVWAPRTRSWISRPP